jgi:hypothetical protein
LLHDTSFDFFWQAGVTALGQRVNKNDDHVDTQHDKQIPYMHTLALPTQCATLVSCLDVLMSSMSGVDLLDALS